LKPLVHRRVHGGVELEGLPGQLLHLAPHPAGREEEHRDHQQDQHGQPPLELHHDEEGHREIENVLQHAAEGAGERLLRAHDVVVHAADQRAGLGPGEEGQGHSLDVVVQGGAEVEDQPLGDAGRQPALEDVEPGIGHRQ